MGDVIVKSATYVYNHSTSRPTRIHSLEVYKLFRLKK